MYAKTGDKEIIGRVLEGNQQIFAELVKRYQHFVFTISLRYAGNREDAEEITQNVFVKAYRSLADFRSDSKFSTWLYSITVNTCSTFLRRKKITTYSLNDERIFGQADTNDATVTDPEEDRSRTALMNKAIRLLNAGDAAIIMLFYKGEQSVEEIGTILGLTPGNVKVRLHRARGKLKNILEKYFAKEIKEGML